MKKIKIDSFWPVEIEYNQDSNTTLITSRSGKQFEVLNLDNTTLSFDDVSVIVRSKLNLWEIHSQYKTREISV